jgi:hypothetical protein
LRWPERESAKDQPTETQRLATTAQIARAQWFGAREHMQPDHHSQRETDRNVPVKEIEAGKTDIASGYPPDTGQGGQRNRDKGKQPKHRAAVPAMGLNDPWPDTSQLAPQQEEKPQASGAMEREDTPLLDVSTDEADETGGASDPYTNRQTPVGDPRPQTPRLRGRWLSGRNGDLSLALEHGILLLEAAKSRIPMRDNPILVCRGGGHSQAITRPHTNVTSEYTSQSPSARKWLPLRKAVTQQLSDAPRSPRSIRMRDRRIARSWRII